MSYLTTSIDICAIAVKHILFQITFIKMWFKTSVAKSFFTVPYTEKILTFSSKLKMFFKIERHF